MTPLERLARAIARMDAEFQYSSACTDEDRALKEQDWGEYLPKARAILQEIREPSEAMVDAAMPNCGASFVGEWERAIDAALEEG